MNDARKVRNTIYRCIRTCQRLNKRGVLPGANDVAIKAAFRAVHRTKNNPGRFKALD